MANPYQAPSSLPTPVVWRRGNRPFTIGAIIAFVAGVLCVTPGAVLLNQELEIIPTEHLVTDVGFNGQSISLDTIVRWSLISGACCAAVSVILVGFAARHARDQRTTRSPAAHDTR